ncbi:unnamed protein product, partial [Prorocentrum cordatum]
MPDLTLVSDFWMRVHLSPVAGERAPLRWCTPQDHLVNFPSSQGLGLHALRELLASNPHSVLGRLGPQRVYDLFSPRGDDGPPAGFLHGFLRWK